MFVEKNNEWVCDTSKCGMACGRCSSCKSKADEKVLDYLERAKKIRKKSMEQSSLIRTKTSNIRPYTKTIQCF